MNHWGRRNQPLLLLAGLLVGLFLIGCGTNPFGVSISPFTSRPTPGRTFDSAPALDLDSNGSARFAGNVGQPSVDMWDLGAVSAGDHITVSVKPALGSQLDPAVALFDGNQDLFAVNDNVDPQHGRIDAAIDQVIRAATPHFYLAITGSFFSSRADEYTAEVHVHRGETAPKVAPQKLMLWFAGGQGVDIQNVGIFNIATFDAANINSDYAGTTDTMKATIIATVRQRYSRFDVILLTDADGLPAEGTDYSTLYFGQFSRTVFGISEDVDSWNANACDDGIIYTDGFDDAFSTKPTSAQLALAIGNVAAHEGGHLLGLSHVADITDLMDTTGAASTLLNDQQFKRSILDRSIFPLGYQNGPKLLYLTVGAAP